MLHDRESVGPIWCNDWGQGIPESPTLAEEEVGTESHSYWPHTKHNALKLFRAANLQTGVTLQEQTLNLHW